MACDKIRVRFAPSPTGELHIGNARTAIYNWLFARHHHGKVVLRIEDTDQKRSTEIYKSNLLQDLRWLDIDWDEGPDKGGDYGPYLQSQRFDIYENYLRFLIDHDLVYPCYCTGDELDVERRDLIAQKKMPRYMGKCRKLNLEERKNLEEEGRKPAYRFKVKAGVIAFDDHIRGPMRFEGETIGDFIVMRSNGLPAYNFAVVIDDHLMQISHVIRGEDHLSNTASQLLLYKALNFEPPQFYHHSLILGLDHTKLSKRHGSVSVGEFRNKGYLPEALVNYLSLMGSSLGEGREICPIETIIPLFNMEKVGKSGALFDEGKLKWMNAIYLRSCNIERLRFIIRPYLLRKGIEEVTDEKLDDFIELVRPNVETIAEVNDYLGIMSDQALIVTEEAHKILKEKKSAELLGVYHQILTGTEDDSFKHLKETIKELSKKTGVKGKELYLPIRAAISGMTSGPELDELFRFMGKDFVLKRIRRVLNEIESG